MRRVVRAAVGALAFGAVFSVTGVAWAHHVYLDFSATGAQVPGGDPDGTASGAIDFEPEESNQMCLVATSANLGAITSVDVVNRTTDAVLISFGASLNTCKTATTEQQEALHDTADEYRIVISTQDYPEGAVAGLFEERPPETTTSSSVVRSSTTTSATTGGRVQAVSTTPKFTG